MPCMAERFNGSAAGLPPCVAQRVAHSATNLSSLGKLPNSKTVPVQLNSKEFQREAAPFRSALAFVLLSDACTAAAITFNGCAHTSRQLLVSFKLTMVFGANTGPCSHAKERVSASCGCHVAATSLKAEPTCASCTPSVLLKSEVNAAVPADTESNSLRALTSGVSMLENVQSLACKACDGSLWPLVL
ncbi:hypothetical protein ONE63_003966 [Megalurothrips usitatus]|uniref:Uncharacterized protein n=1 Tax=Megalurothrips usitatus TaxID=439358 RepID=A0AAV7X8Y2_9NEOP|nr:hypothetical protein ONE63_003966 [Megalurothrips usitatus]